MKTLTEEEFQQKYGGIAASKFGPEPGSSLFSELKKNLQDTLQSNSQILNTPQKDALGNVAQGTELAANSARGAVNAAGSVINRIPVIGPVVKGVTDLAQKGFNAVTDKLSDTKFMQEAAAGTPEGGTLEKALKIASNVGEISGDVATADSVIPSAKTALNVTKKVTKAATEALPDVSGATKYVKGAIRDVTPTKQGIINHQVAKALDLTPGDLNTLFQSTGNDVGRFLAENNLIGTNKATTQNLIKGFFEKNYKEVRSEIGKVKKTYTPDQVPRLTDTLKSLAGQTEGVLGLENAGGEIKKLLQKPEVTLSDVQRVKELLDKHYNLYNKMGDVSQNTAKQGLANVRDELKTFIEKEVKNNTGADIEKLNNNVATSKELSDMIETRTPRGITRSNITWRDAMVGLGLYAFASPVVGIGAVFVSKVLESPTFRLRMARFLDSISDAQKAKINASLRGGVFPKELEAATKMIDSQLTQATK